jgi:hypothetical protein
MGRKVSPITRKLRDMEMTYVLSGEHRSVINRARVLITDLWELHCQPEADIKRKSAEIFRKVGLEILK